MSPVPPHTKFVFFFLLNISYAIGMNLYAYSPNFYELSCNTTNEKSVLGIRVIINIELPTNLEVFLEKHISSFRRASITRGNISSALEEHNSFNEVDTGVQVDTIQRSPDNIL
jgi:hypothetical protein